MKSFWKSKVLQDIFWKKRRFSWWWNWRMKISAFLVFFYTTNILDLLSVNSGFCLHFSWHQSIVTNPKFFTTPWERHNWLTTLFITTVTRFFQHKQVNWSLTRHNSIAATLSRAFIFIILVLEILVGSGLYLWKHLIFLTTVGILGCFCHFTCHSVFLSIDIWSCPAI